MTGKVFSTFSNLVWITTERAWIWYLTIPLPIFVCGTKFYVENKKKNKPRKTPEYKVPPHFFMVETKIVYSLTKVRSINSIIMVYNWLLLDYTSFGFFRATESFRTHFSIPNSKLERCNRYTKIYFRLLSTKSCFLFFCRNYFLPFKALTF